MKLCYDNCHPICDFCLNYKDDGSGFIENGRKKGLFKGEGFCVKKDKRVYADESCNDDFECFHTLNIHVELSDDAKKFEEDIRKHLSE